MSLIRSTSVYTAMNVISSSVPFLLMPVLTRYLTPEDYGIIAMFGVLLGIVGTLTGLSVHGAIARQYFEKGEIDFPKYVTCCFLILVVSTMVVSLFIWMCSGYIDRYSGFPGSWLGTVVAVSVGQFITTIILTLWQVQVKPVAYGVFQILISVANVAFSILFVVVFDFGWRGRVVGQVITYSVFTLISFAVLLKGSWLKVGYESSYVRHALKFGVPLIPHVLGMFLIAFSSRILMKNMCGLAETGIFLAGLQISMVIWLLQDSFNRAWVPWFFGHLKADNETSKRLIVKITYAYFVVILAIAMFFALIAPLIIKFFLGKDFRDATVYVVWISLGYAFNGMYKMVTNYIYYVNKTYLVGCITLVAATINVICGYLLIRINGRIGAAQAMMFSFLLSYLITWFVSAKIYPMPWISVLRDAKFRFVNMVAKL